MAKHRQLLHVSTSGITETTGITGDCLLKQQQPWNNQSFQSFQSFQLYRHDFVNQLAEPEGSVGSPRTIYGDRQPAQSRKSVSCAVLHG
jgi:hypothetical protein